MLAEYNLAEPALLRRAVTEIAQLPTPDLQAVVDFMAQLRDRRIKREAANIANQVRQHIESNAIDPSKLPQSELAKRFNKVIEEVREEAIVLGNAIDGDWHDD